MTGNLDLPAMLGQATRWASLSFFLNLPWEAAHVPLYTMDPGKGMRTISYAVVHCPIGDGVIALAAYVAGALVVRDAFWPSRNR
jgi:hypothetical protein